MKYILIVSLMLSLAAGVGARQDKDIRPSYDETFFDFGHLGIDYKAYHRFPLVNRTDDTIRILGVHVPCDCSRITSTDSVLAPGESMTFNLTYSTKDFYGPQNKTFRVDTDHAELAHVEYFYLSIIGVWFDGLRPQPMALFFLPTHKEKTISIANTSFDRIDVEGTYQQDDYVTIEVTNGTAEQDESLVLTVRPVKDLRPGTFHSNVTLTIDKGEDSEPTILTIPIKVVRY